MSKVSANQSSTSPGRSARLPKGKIAVATRSRDGRAVLEVADRGIGIDPREQQRIFEPFYRVESGLTRETRGVGIGLSVVRSIVEAHGGAIEVVANDAADAVTYGLKRNCPSAPCAHSGRTAR